ELAPAQGRPMVGAVVWGVGGRRRHAPEVNVLMSLLTLVAAVLLVARVIRHGSMLVWREQFFIDPFNVFLVALTAFVGLTTALFSRPYLPIEVDVGRVSSLRLRLSQSI